MKRHPTLEETEQLVRSKLEGQNDDAGVPMADHMARVVAGVLHYEDPQLPFIAWLHDLVEDTDVTLIDLASMGYDPTIVEAVSLLTKPDELTYSEYIERLLESENWRAIAVKLSDNIDNTDPKRWLYLNPYKANALRKRYAGVREKLQFALQELHA